MKRTKSVAASSTPSPPTTAKKRAAKKGITVVTPLTGTLIIDPPTGDVAHRAAWDKMWAMLTAKYLPYVLEMAQSEHSQAA